MRWFYKEIMIMMGGIIVCAGLIITPLPIPLGVPLTAIGIVLLLKHSHYAKKLYIKLRIFAHDHMHGLSNFLVTLEKFWRQRSKRKKSSSQKQKLSAPQKDKT